LYERNHLRDDFSTVRHFAPEEGKDRLHGLWASNKECAAFNKAFTKTPNITAFDADVLFARLSSGLAFY
jgi:hypothetical protein